LEEKMTDSQASFDPGIRELTQEEIGAIGGGKGHSQEYLVVTLKDVIISSSVDVQAFNNGFQGTSPAAASVISP
jgi:hypothetical protein